MKRYSLLLAAALLAALSFSSANETATPSFANQSVLTVEGIQGPCPEVCRLPNGDCEKDCP